ncbi:MAG: NAD-dependent epimerase/dehydratase family protein, partial [Alphaproteobacteria bacterium]|nr:NAD-dependent epimerase/dehydratase family protein [Alphaproteobacteria bacterium]
MNNIKWLDKFHLLLLDEVDSTNNEAKRIALTGQSPDYLVVCAKRQTNGRGRYGNSWESVEGNLFMSLIVPVSKDLDTMSQLSFISAVALDNVISNLFKTHNIDVKIARLHNVFGPRSPYRGGREKVIAALCRKVIEETSTIDVWGNGNQTRTFLYIVDCITGIEKIMQTLGMLHYSQEFKDQIILDTILNKAGSLEEWYVFLEFLIKNNILEEQLPEYLEQPSLTKITDVIESKILSESLHELKALEHLNLEEIVNQITYLCYQLKSFGWSSQGLAHILQKITGDNIHYFASSLKTIFEYRITEEQRNKQGECVFDIINRYSNDDLESAVYLIANNQFERKLENKGEVLLE